MTKIPRPADVRISNGRTHFKCYGKTFAFIPTSAKDVHPVTVQKSRDDAEQAAFQYGRQRLDALSKQLGRPLTAWEKTFGKEQPVREKMSGSLKPAENPDHNPWSVRVAELEKTHPQTSGDRQRLAVRLDQARRSEAQWAATREFSKTQAERDGDMSIQLARKHAGEHLEKLRLDPTATSAEIADQEARKASIDGMEASAGSYWQSLPGMAQPPDVLPKARTLLEPMLEE